MDVFNGVFFYVPASLFWDLKKKNLNQNQVQGEEFLGLLCPVITVVKRKCAPFIKNF